MSTKKETERTKLMQEKCQNLITSMLKDEDNKYCVDCDAKGPRWASWNLGVFLCIRCAGIHRNLGVHITRVKSVNLDTWTPEQVVSLQQMGNSRARAVYEAQLPDGFRRPQTDAALEVNIDIDAGQIKFAGSFIRAKYEQKKYVAKEWVPSPPPKVDWEKEIDEELEKQKRKKKSLTAGGGGSAILGAISSPNSVEKVSTSKPTPIPAPLPKPKSSAHSPKTGRPQLELSTPAAAAAVASNGNQNTSSNTLDLLGLSSPPPAAGTTGAGAVASGKDQGSASNGSGCASDDEFNNFFSANSQSRQQQQQSTEAKKTNDPKSLAQEEADFFNQSVPSDAEKAKLTKDSIMALYGSQPAAAATGATAQSIPQVSNNPNSNLNLLAGLGNPIVGGGAGGFPSPFMHQQQQQNNGGFPSQVANNGLNHHFGGLNLGQQPQQMPPQGQFGGQFGQMQSQFNLNGVGGGNGGFNLFNGNNGIIGHHQVMPQQHQQPQQQQGMNFFPGTGMGGGFPQQQQQPQNPMMQIGGKGGFNIMGQQPQQQLGMVQPIMGGAGGLMGSNSNGSANQFPFAGQGLMGNGGVPQLVPTGGLTSGTGGQTNGAAGLQQQQFGNLNLGNVWQ